MTRSTDFDSARRFLVVAACLWMALSSSCGGSPRAATPPAARVHPGVLHFYPLDLGWHWSFELRQTGGEGELAGRQILAVSKVDSFDGRRAIVKTGTEALVLELSPNGLVRQPSGTVLLRYPIVEGDSWSGASSTVRVASTHARVVSAAGTFEDCVETVESFSGDEAREIRTTYCPEVGPAQVDIHAMDGTAPVSLAARLRSFGPSQDLGARPTP